MIPWAQCLLGPTPSMIPIKTIVIEQQVRRDIPSVKQACNLVISPGISHVACESVETAIPTFRFGRLFSIFHHALKNVSLIEILIRHSTCDYAKRIKQKFPPLRQFSHVFGTVFRSSEFHFISSYSPVSQKNIFY